MVFGRRRKLLSVRVIILRTSALLKKDKELKPPLPVSDELSVLSLGMKKGRCRQVILAAAPLCFSY